MTDSEIVRDWLEHNQADPVPWQIRQAYRVGSSRAKRLAQLIRSSRHSKAPSLSTTVSFEGKVPLNPEELVQRYNLDLDLWEVVRFSTRSWNTQHKGNVLTMYYSRADLKPRVNIKNFAKVVERLSKKIPAIASKPVRASAKSLEGENLLLINISDIHVGKYFPGQDGYDIQTAVDLYLKAVATFVERASSGQPIHRIVHVIGNDMLHVDHRTESANGTPQDTDGMWWEAIEPTIEMVVQATEKMRELAPVDVVVVPGNHDEEKAIMLGHVIKATYRNSEDVQVILSHDLAVYYTWGSVLLGFTHGNSIKYSRLPMIMAEHPDWSRTKFREWHIGHVHHEKDISFVSSDGESQVMIHVHPSLSRPDYWHRKKGFVTSIQSAVAFVYNKKEGNISSYRYYGG